MSSTITRRRWRDLGTLTLVTGAVLTVAGLLPIVALLATDTTDPFGAMTTLCLLITALGVALLGAAALIGLVGLIVERSWRRAAVTVVGIAASLTLVLVVIGWIGDEGLHHNEWLLPAALSALALTGLVATVQIRRPGLAVASAGAVVVAGTALGWVVASRLEVDVLTGPVTMRAAAVDVAVIFNASESGSYELRTAEGCSTGRRLASGTYGPGWEERSDRHAAEQPIPLGDLGLVAGPQTLVVCVRHGVAQGEDRFEATIDDTFPAKPTLRVADVTDTGDGTHYTSPTRHLRFSGSADPGAGALEGHTASGTYPVRADILAGHWTVDWDLSQATDEASFGFVAVDEAGNTARSDMVHVRITGDPPPIELPEHPGLQVECRAEAGRTPHECATRARQALIDRPELLEDAVRLIVTGADQYGSCYAESRKADGFLGIGFALTCP